METVMKRKRYFGVIVEPKRAEMHCDELPELEDDELLLKLEVCNICTTDYQQWLGLRAHQGFPRAAGHEFCGIVIEKGSKVHNRFQIGDRVGPVFPEFCGVCENCQRGRTGDCVETDYFSKIGPDGYYGTKSFANYRIIKERYATPLSKEIPAADAAFLEPVSTVVHCIKEAGVYPNARVVVIGVGTMGILNAQVAHAWGASVIMTDISEKKIARAEAMGIGKVINSSKEDAVERVKELTGGVGADIVIVSVGNTQAYKQGYAMMKKTGAKLILFPAGYPKPELIVDPNELHYRKISIIGTLDGDCVDYVDAAQLINSGRVKPSFAHEGVSFDLKDIQSAFEAAARPDAYRVSVDLQNYE